MTPRHGAARGIQQSAREEAAQAEQRAQLRAFMDQNEQRMQAHRASTMSEPGQAETSQPEASGARCCINGAFYECGSAAAVDRCSGAFMRCVAGCGGACVESCLRSDPPDPSACTRVSSRDGEC